MADTPVDTPSDTPADTDTPSSPFAPVSNPDMPKSPPLVRTLFTVALTVCTALLVGAASAAFVVHETMQYMEHEVDLVQTQVDVMKQQSTDTVFAIRKIADEIKTPPNNDKLFTILSKGVGVTEDIYRTDAVAAAPKAAFATDLTAVQQTDAYTQEALISNTDLTSPALHYLCVKPFAWVGGQTCTVTCAASGLTCSAAATDGLRLSPGQMISRRWDGTACVCVMGSANPTAYQSERVIR